VLNALSFLFLFVAAGPFIDNLFLLQARRSQSEPEHKS
jgi:hypothetical protein